MIKYIVHPRMSGNENSSKSRTTPFKCEVLSKIAKSTEVENRMVVARAWGEGDKSKVSFMPDE